MMERGADSRESGGSSGGCAEAIAKRDGELAVRDGVRAGRISHCGVGHELEGTGNSRGGDRVDRDLAATTFGARLPLGAGLGDTGVRRMGETNEVRCRPPITEERKGEDDRPVRVRPGDADDRIVVGGVNEPEDYGIHGRPRRAVDRGAQAGVAGRTAASAG